MGKNYVESSLKRFLKRKVKITLGFVVAFMITGTVGFAEGEAINQMNGEKEYNNLVISNTIDQGDWSGDKDNPRQVGVALIGQGTKGKFLGDNLSVVIKPTENTKGKEIAGIVIRQNATGIFDAKTIKIDVNSNGNIWGYGLLINTAGVGKFTENVENVDIITKRTGYTAQTLTVNNGQLNFNNTGNVTISAESEYGVTGISSYGKLTFNNTGNVNITGELLPGDKTGQANVVGIQSSYSGVETIVTDKVNEFKITLKGAGIDNDGTSYSTGTKGIKTDEAAIVHINSKYFTLNMDIGKDVTVAPPEGHTASEAYGLDTSDGYFTSDGKNLYYSGGEIKIGENTITKIEINQGIGTAYGIRCSGDGNFETGKPNEMKGDIISLSNMKSNVEILGDTSIKVTAKDKAYALFGADGGNIVVGGKDKSVQIEGDIHSENLATITLQLSTADSFLKGAITDNNGNNAGIVNITMDNGAKWDNTGDSSITNLTVGNNSIVNSENKIGISKALTNAGTINLSNGASMNLATGSTLVNEDAGTINVASGATAITGAGTAENRGLINLADTDNTDGTISKLLSETATLTNKGTIALQDKTGTMTDKEWNNLLKELSAQGFTNTGMIVDSTGKTIFSGGTTITDSTVGDIAGGSAQDNGAIKIEDKGQSVTTITGSKTGKETDTLKDITVNVEGNLTLKQETVTSGTGAGVVMEDVTMNVSSGNSVTATGEGHKLLGNVVLNGESSIVVGDGQGTSDSNLTLSGAVSQGATEENKVATIKVESDGTLNLVDATVNVAINSNATGQTGTVTSSGETSIKDITASELTIGGKDEASTTVVDGTIKVTNIVVGKDLPSTFALFAANDIPELPATVDKLELTSTSKFGEAGTLTIKENGQVFLGIGSKVTDGKYSENAFGNSTSTVTVTGTGKIVLDTTNISGKEAVIGLGANHNFNDFAVDNFVSGSEIYKVDDNNLTDGLTIKYNDTLFEGSNELSAVHNAASVLAGGTFAGTKAEREVQLDKIYSSNIYSETVKAAYDTVKMNEEAVLSLARKSEVGKWTAEGKALYSKDEYDRNGTVGDYSSEIESTGLMAAFGYGLNETTTAGVAFSGVKQDVDTDGGSADADLFYLGVYGNKVVGNYDFTAGLGYQFGEYEADNTIANVHGSDKYDSKALSGYVQGRYTADLGDGLSLQPRVRLGYTYVEQDDARDSYFGVSDAEISTFDAEFGLDTVKSVQLEKSKVDVKFGVSYVRTMGDTDDEFTGRFYGATASEGFNVLGAELAENVVKFNLGAEVTNENGFFYNGGFTYEFGSNDTDAYGVNVGVGYKF